MSASSSTRSRRSSARTCRVPAQQSRPRMLTAQAPTAVLSREAATAWRLPKTSEAVQCRRPSLKLLSRAIEHDIDRVLGVTNGDTVADQRAVLRNLQL